MVITRYLFTYRLSDKQYLLVNSLSGAVDLVEVPLLKDLGAIRRGEPHGLDDSSLAYLYERGYVYDSREDEEAVVSRAIRLTERFRLQEQALCFVLCPTITCNLRCPYCFEPHSLHEQNRVMSLEQVDQAFLAIDQVREMRPEIPNASINLFGGEPLLPTTMEIVTKILRLAAERDLPIAVTSNGTHLVRFLDILKPYREYLAFDITMDGTKEIHDQRRITAAGTGTFDRIAEGVSALLAEGFRVKIRMNLDAANIASVPDLLAFAKDRGWHNYENFGVSLSPVTNYTGTVDHDLLPAFEVEARVHALVSETLWNEVSVELNGDFSRLHVPISQALGESRMKGKFMPSLYYCEASGALFYCMGPDGLIYPCNQIIHDPLWAIGRYDPHLYIDPEKAALWQDRAVTNMPKCGDCSIAFLCAGGCPVMANRMIGSPMDSYCGTAKQELAAYLRQVGPKLIQLE